MKPYLVYVQREVLMALSGLPKPRRLPIESFIDSLEMDPFQAGDYVEDDSTQRPLSFRLIDKHVVAFWADHSVSEVKVVSLGLAD